MFARESSELQFPFLKHHRLPPLQDFLALIDQLPKIEAGSWMELRHLGGAAARARRCGAAGSRAASAPLQTT